MSSAGKIPDRLKEEIFSIKWTEANTRHFPFLSSPFYVGCLVILNVTSFMLASRKLFTKYLQNRNFET